MQQQHDPVLILVYNIGVIIFCYLHPIYDHLSYNQTLQGIALERTRTKDQNICDVLLRRLYS